MVQPAEHAVARHVTSRNGSAWGVRRAGACVARGGACVCAGACAACGVRAIAQPGVREGEGAGGGVRAIADTLVASVPLGGHSVVRAGSGEVHG